MNRTAKLEGILKAARMPYISCFLGSYTGHVVCRSDTAVKKIGLMLAHAFTIRGYTHSRKANKAQHGSRICESHDEYTVHFLI